MIKNSECIVDENGIEINISYLYEKSDSQIEEGHGYHEVGLQVTTELKSVDVLIAGEGINILPLLTERQKDSIIEKLQYE